MYDLVIFCDFPPTQWDDDTPNWYQENKGIRCTSVLINGPSIHTTWNLFLMQWKRVKATSENTKQRGEMKSLSLFEESYKKYLQGKWIKWAFWDSNVASQSQTPPHPLRHFSQGSNVSLLYSNMNYSSKWQRKRSTKQQGSCIRTVSQMELPLSINCSNNILLCNFHPHCTSHT